MSTETPSIIQPRSHKASVVLWGDLSVTDMDRLETAVTADQLKGVLSEVFKLTDHGENAKSAILLDLFYYTIQFARDQRFTKEQSSAFFSIVKKTHEVNIETPFSNVDHCFRYFRDLLLCHSVKRPPFSVYLFSVDEVRHITEYVMNTYFRHYKLYKYVFAPQVRLDLTVTYEGMPETPAASEAGEEPEKTAVTEEETGEIEAETEGVTSESNTEPQAEPTEEKPAASELRDLVRQQITEEIKKIKLDLDSQLKQSEDTLNQRLAAVEGTSGGKSGRASAKGKKK